MTNKIIVNRNSVSNSIFTLSPLNLDEYKKIPERFCGEEDLDDFFHNDAEKYDKALICKTYKFVANQDEKKILGLVGLSNDAIRFESNKQLRKIPNDKRLRSFPAVKIARLGVLKQLHGAGIGTLMLNFLKYFFIFENRTACKYITLDAYPDAIKFYEKQNFIAVLEKDGTLTESPKGIRSMFFHLSDIEK